MILVIHQYNFENISVDDNFNSIDSDFNWIIFNEVL